MAILQKFEIDCLLEHRRITLEVTDKILLLISTDKSYLLIASDLISTDKQTLCKYSTATVCPQASQALLCCSSALLLSIAL